MTDTMMSMELVFADYLLPNQLAEGDLIKIDGQYLTVKKITENKEGFNLTLTDDFDDEIETFISDDEKIEWYVFIE
jgi:hypothetical protein